MMVSLPFTSRQVRATERVLDAIYNAAHLGLKGDALALHAKLLPREFRALRELDPMVELAELQGRADAEAAHARKLAEASFAGDAKASLAILQHQHGWVAKQQLDVNVTQISVMAALEEARGRLLEHNDQTGADEPAQTNQEKRLEDNRANRQHQSDDGSTLARRGPAVSEVGQDLFE